MNTVQRMANPKIAFIVGHYKCGTTWLINMLSLHPNIIGIAETNLFKYAFSTGVSERLNILFSHSAWGDGGIRRLPRRVLGRFVNPIRKLWKPVVGLSRTERPITRHSFSPKEQLKLRNILLSLDAPDAFCKAFFDFHFNKFDTKCLIEKSADHVKAIPKIKKVYPESILIAVYRDGRDFVVSHKYYAKNMGLSWSFEESVLLWKKMIETQLDYEKEYKLWTCSYEAMLLTPKRIAREILGLLDLDFTENILEEMVKKSSFEFITGRKPGESNGKSFYRKGVSGDWRNHFTEEEKVKFKSIAGDLLIKLNYEQDNNW